MKKRYSWLKMNMPTNLIALLVIISLFLGCSGSEHKLPDYEKIADQITAKTADKMQKEKKLYLIGTGGGMINDIQRMSMTFNYYQVVDLNGARELVVYGVREYLSAINSSDQIRPYLHEYPFTENNVGIVIHFHCPDGSTVPSEKITVVAARRGKVKYSIVYPDEYSLKTIHEETYDEAVQLVKDEHAH